MVQSQGSCSYIQAKAVLDLLSFFLNRCMCTTCADALESLCGSMRMFM